MPKITELWAYIMEDDGPDDEGIIGFLVEGQWYPLVGADMERMKSYRAVAQRVADESGKPIKLQKFSHMEELEVIRPNGGPASTS